MAVIDGRNTLGVHSITTVRFALPFIFLLHITSFPKPLGLIYLQNLIDIALLDLGWKNSGLLVSIGKLLSPKRHGLVLKPKLHSSEQTTSF